MSKITDFLKSVRPIISFDASSGSPSFAIELDRKIQLNNKEIEDRINQLDDVKDKLIKAADAISHISDESRRKKTELELLRNKLEQINKEKEVAETILEVDKESFARLLISTNKRTEKRSILIGIGIGFVTGSLSSLLVWLLT